MTSLRIGEHPNENLAADKILKNVVAEQLGEDSRDTGE
jgi:hypothetical protein